MKVDPSSMQPVRSVEKKRESQGASYEPPVKTVGFVIATPCDPKQCEQKGSNDPHVHNERRVDQFRKETRGNMSALSPIPLAPNGPFLSGDADAVEYCVGK